MRGLLHETFFSLSAFRSLQLDAGVSGGDVLEKRRRVFADDGLSVVAANVVPFDSVLVDVVEDTKARFFRLVDLEFSVVRLRPFKVASSAPWLVTPTSWGLVRLGQLDARAGPEPTVDQNRLQVFTIATLEVAQTSTRPDVREFLCLRFFGI